LYKFLIKKFRCSSFSDRVRRNKRLAAVNSCTWRFFGHFSWRSPISHRLYAPQKTWRCVCLEIWRTVRCVRDASSSLKKNLSKILMLQSVRALPAGHFPVAGQSFQLLSVQCRYFPMRREFSGQSFSP